MQAPGLQGGAGAWKVRGEMSESSPEPPKPTMAHRAEYALFRAAEGIRGGY